MRCLLTDRLLQQICDSPILLAPHVPWQAITVSVHGEQVCGYCIAGSRERGMHAAHNAAAQELARAKKFKATEAAPAHASKEVWASIFTSSRPEAKETYGCRALSSRGLA